MALTSASTDDEVRAAYEDNAGYDQANSATMARAFAVACRFILMRRPLVGALGGGNSTTFDAQSIREEKARAEKFAATSPANGGGVKFLDFSNLRS